MATRSGKNPAKRVPGRFRSCGHDGADKIIPIFTLNSLPCNPVPKQVRRRDCIASATGRSVVPVFGNESALCAFPGRASISKQRTRENHMMATNDDEGSPVPSAYFSGEAATIATRDDHDLAPYDVEFDASSQDSQLCASTVSQATSSGIFASIENLREIMARCFEGKPLDGDLAAWLGEAIDGFLTRQFCTLDEGLGLIFPRGGIPWWREEAMRKRDAALRYLAETFLGELTLSMQAQEIWTTARRYAASTWRFDHDNDDMPVQYAGTPRECLWQAFKSGAPMPIGERQLRNILGH
jgi:hypothetical protein